MSRRLSTISILLFVLLAVSGYVAVKYTYILEVRNQSLMDETIYVSGAAKMYASGTAKPTSFLAGGPNFYIPIITNFLNDNLGLAAGCAGSKCDLAALENQIRDSMRHLTVMVQILTILALAYVAWRLTSDLLAAGMVTLVGFTSEFFLVEAYFYYPDHIITLPIVMTMYCAHRITNGGSYHWYAAAAFSVALAASIKYSGILAVFMPAAAHLFRQIEVRSFLLPFTLMAAVAAFSVLVSSFVIFNPFIVVEPLDYLRALAFHVQHYSKLHDGGTIAPFSEFYPAGSTFIFYMKVLLFSTFGLLGLIPMITGFVVFLMSKSVHQKATACWCLCYLIIFLFVVSGHSIAFARNASIVMPITVLFSALGLVFLLRKMFEIRMMGKCALLVLLGLIILEPVANAASFVRHQFQPYARDEAFQWFEARQDQLSEARIAYVTRTFWRRPPVPLHTLNVQNVNLLHTDPAEFEKMLAGGGYEYVVLGGWIYDRHIQGRDVYNRYRPEWLQRLMTTVGLSPLYGKHPAASNVKANTALVTSMYELAVEFQGGYNGESFRIYRHRQ